VGRSGNASRQTRPQGLLDPGRLLTPSDFPEIVHKYLRGSQYTPRLVSRLGLDPIAIAQDPLPDHVVKKWAETTLRNVIKDQGGQFQGLKRVEINGEEIVLIFRREAVQYRAGPGIKAMIADLRWDRIRPGTINLDVLAWENEQ